MTKTKAGPVSGERIKSFVERVEKLMEERKAIGGDIRDVFAEAKGVGYDVRTMRKLIQIRAQDAADRAEQETLLDVYMHAVGMEGTNLTIVQPTEEELEERAGRIIAEVDRCMALVTAGKPPKIDDIKDLIGCSTGKAHKLRGFVTARLSQSNSFHRENENPPALTAEEEEALWQEFRRDDDAEDLDLDQNEVQQSGTTIFAESANNESCELCPVPPGSVTPDNDGNGLRTKGRAEPLADTARGHSSAGCDDALAFDGPTTQSEDRASPGPHDTQHASDCAVHNEPAYPAGPCDCGTSGDTRGEAPANPPPMSDEEALSRLQEVEAEFRRALRSKTEQVRVG